MTNEMWLWKNNTNLTINRLYAKIFDYSKVPIICADPIICTVVTLFEKFGGILFVYQVKKLKIKILNLCFLLIFSWLNFAFWGTFKLLRCINTKEIKLQSSIKGILTSFRSDFFSWKLKVKQRFKIQYNFNIWPQVKHFEYDIRIGSCLSFYEKKWLSLILMSFEVTFNYYYFEDWVFIRIL